MRLKSLLVVVVSLLGVVSAGGQEVTGTILGTVTDAQGKAVPNATVTVTNTDKEVVIRTVTANELGEYVAPLLPIGHYSVSAEAQGFKKTVQMGIMLNVNDRLAVNPKLEVGALAAEITVEAPALQVETQTPMAAGLITGTQIRELAINTRNYEQLVFLMPGVSTGIASDQLYVGVSNPLGTSNQINFSVNGNRPTQNNWSVDGADNVDRGANLTLLTYPSVDSIEELKVLRGQYDPEFGRSSSGEINVITRSGANSYHASLYEFFRNNVLNANSFLNNRATPDPIPRPPLRYNDFGGTFGGPIYRSKTFFFFSEEVRRVITKTTFNGSFPSTAERQGIFANDVCTQHNPTNNMCVSGPARNISALINPAAAAYVKDIFSTLPAPDANDNFTFTGTNTFNLHQEIIKVDHVFGPKLSLSGRFENDTIPTVEPGGIFTGSPLPGVATTQSNSPGRSFTVRGTATLSPTLLNEGGYAYSYGAVVSDPAGLGSAGSATDVIAAVTLPFKSTLTRVSNLSFFDSAFSSSVTGFGQYRDFNRNHNWFDNVTKIAGRHTFKTGFSFHWYQKSENNGSLNVGSFSFNDTTPSGGHTFQQEFASFLIGEVQTFTQSSVDFVAEIRQKTLEVYAQDSFRVRPNLTLVYGVRYSRFGQPTDASGRATNFSPSLFDRSKAPQINPVNGQIVAGTLQNPLNGIIIGGTSSPFGKGVGRTDPHNFAPRLGFAWDPFKTGKTSIRGGYGIFWDSPAVGFIENQLFLNPPFVSSITISNTRLDNPGIVAPNVSLLPPPLGAFDPEWKQPYTQEWSLDAQRELMRNLVLDVGYYGSKGTHLIGFVDINQPLPGAAVAAGIVTPPITGGTKTNQLNAVRPFRGYDAINMFSPRFDSQYHSLQVSLQKRLPGSSLIAANYTWANTGTTAQSDFRTPQNTYDIAAERGPTQFDRRHTLNANFVYELPWLRNQQRLTGHVFGGWEFSGIVYVYSGLPLTATAGLPSFDPAGQGVLDPRSQSARRPNQVADPNAAAPHTFDQWFDTSAFMVPPFTQMTPGSAPRGSIRGPGVHRWDLSLFKNTKIREGMQVQFRAETFNIFNHTNFDTIQVSKTSQAFGRVTGTRDPRIMQLGLKFSF